MSMTVSAWLTLCIGTCLGMFFGILIGIALADKHWRKKSSKILYSYTDTKHIDEIEANKGNERSDLL